MHFDTEKMHTILNNKWHAMALTTENKIWYDRKIQSSTQSYYY